MRDDVAKGERSEPFRAGESAGLRSLHPFGPRGRAVSFAAASRALADDDQVAVIASGADRMVLDFTSDSRSFTAARQPSSKTASLAVCYLTRSIAEGLSRKSAQ